MNADTILKKFERFGVNLGLERISALLENLGNPHQQLNVIHVAGTNGKGSVCAYLSSILTAAGYRTGRFISPHLIDWTERIYLNEQPISPTAFEELLLEVDAAIKPDNPTPTQFEVITAAAWLYFARQKVDVAVMEVGLGGRLDATNVCDKPLVAIITSISREHWQRLGPTLADIAGEKAGILKSASPAVVGKLPPEAREVVEKRIASLGCPAVWVEPACPISSPPGESLGWASLVSQKPGFLKKPGFSTNSLEYPLPMLGEVQLLNSAIAIAAIEVLQQQGWSISTEAIQRGMAETKWPGRLQWITWQGRRLLIDGAHNPAAAGVLRQYIDSLNVESVTWVMGMLSTKDHADVFRELLRGGDRLYLVPVPDHSSAIPEELGAIAKDICPNLESVLTYSDLFAALEGVVKGEENLIVLCGSLYLIGHFFRTISPNTVKK